MALFDNMSNGYGTNNPTANGHTTGGNESSALIPKAKSNKPDWKGYFNCNVSRRRADLVLLFTYITTGLLDSAATAAWGSFVSMQTGNTIYVGLGLASPSTTRWIKSGTVRSIFNCLSNANESSPFSRSVSVHLSLPDFIADSL